MILQIDFTSSDPLYRQIRNQVVQGVASGELAPGDSLPSVRALASDLGVNMHTVNKAYALLRDEGYITMRGRSGASVADANRTVPTARMREQIDQIASGLLGLAVEYRARGGSEEDFYELARRQAQAVYHPEKEVEES